MVRDGGSPPEIPGQTVWATATSIEQETQEMETQAQKKCLRHGLPSEEGLAPPVEAIGVMLTHASQGNTDLHPEDILEAAHALWQR